ncbi:MAG TPA: cyclic nucleotide-binding domain-containing protein [Pirellulales bacterium]|nr:cyclic nucleotide-binding domain-containing protein [Pirellulales bacterium]
MQTQPIETLSRFSLFSDLSRNDLDDLLPSFEQCSYPVGGVVFEKGENNPALYLLLDGAVEIAFDVPGHQNAVIVRVEPGGVVGESSFFCSAPHSATARCVEPSTLLRLSRCEYSKLLENRSVPALQVANRAAEILATRLQATNQWLAELLAEEQQHVMEKWRRFRKGIGIDFAFPNGFVHTT